MSQGTFARPCGLETFAGWLGSLVLLGLGLAACASNSPRPATDRAGQPVERAYAPERFDPAPVIEVHLVHLDGAPRGYLKLKEDESFGGGLPLYVVYDDYFVEVGFFTRGGRTFAVNGDTLDDLGIRGQDDSLRLLLGGTRESEVALMPVSKVRTLESDAEEAAAAEAAKKGG